MNNLFNLSVTFITIKPRRGAADTRCRALSANAMDSCDVRNDHGIAGQKSANTVSVTLPQAFATDQMVAP